MGRYRKKPVEIDAVRFTGTTTSAVAIQRWMDGHGYVQPRVETRDRALLEIATLEGVMSASPGDYIIKGVQGEFYPCRGDIFEQTYEPVEAS